MTNRKASLDVLLAIDGSDHSLDATRHLIALLGRSEDLRLVHVLNVQEPVEFIELAMGPTARAIEEARKHAGRSAVQAACALLEAAGLRYEADVRTGDVAATIDAYAHEKGCGLIVIGPRGLGAIRDLVLGSIAVKLIHLSKVPLLLAK